MTKLWIIPHTHWDREWYEPHDVFRARLVAMLDGLLHMLEEHPAYKFTLDGQSAAFEDYLEIRPEATERMRSAVARGQLALGPFQILLDEFACDGETIIRNLEIGIHAARRMGGEMRVGYLPDMFGHAAQMPQILRGFGLTDACLWRGAPARVQRHGFVWEALNGDAVRVEYLWDGYGNALKLFDPIEKLPELVSDYVKTNSQWFSGEPVAGMLGTDHLAPRADLTDVVDEYNRAGYLPQMQIGTIEDVISSRDHSPDALAALPIVRGEMRSHARGNLLPGVFSIRTNIKAAMAEAERALTTAERFDVLVGGTDRRTMINRGWGLVVESTAHDSVTGCGADSTAEEVETRLHVATHTARGAIDIGLDDLATMAPSGSLAVFNQLGWEREIQAEIVIEGEDPPSGAQLLERLPTVIGDERIQNQHLHRILKRIHGQELFGGQIRGWTWNDDVITFEVAPFADGAFDLSEFSAALTQRTAAAAPEKLWTVRTTVPPSMRVLVSGHVDGLAAGVLEPGRGELESQCRRDGSTLTNGVIRATVRPDGLVDITSPTSGASLRGALGLIDEGDCGDSYNFGPVEDPAVETPRKVEIRFIEEGPLRTRCTIRRTLRVPSSLAQENRRMRSQETVDLIVDTKLELRAGEPFLRVSVETTNVALDHRLRVLVPTLGRELETSASAGQYGVTTRGRIGEGGWGEYPLPTFPTTRFVHAGGVAALVDKLVEYEVVDGESDASDAIALTVLRSVGFMSVNLHPLRDEPAGSEVPTPAAQYLGKQVRLNFAIDLSAPQWSASDLVRHSEQFRFEPIQAMGIGALPVAAEVGFSTHGRVALESLRRVDGTLEARLVNYCRQPEPLRVRAQGQWKPCDLTGDVTGSGIDPWHFEVPAGAILTLRKFS